MSYNTIVDEKAEKKLRRIPLKDALKVRDLIRSLSQNPRPIGSIKLEGSNDKYRVRYGDYRVVYKINDSELLILVIDFGHRREIYR